MIPFYLHPMSWGLKGQQLEIEQARYELGDGYIFKKEELELKLKYKDISQESHDADLLELDYRFGELTDEQYETNKIELLPDTDEKKRASFDCLFKFGHISEREYNKSIHSLEGKAWVDISSDFDPKEGIDGVSFDLDWNDVFIEELRENDYEGDSDDDLVDAWLADICKTIAAEENVIPFNPATVIQSFKNKEAGTTDYS